MLDYTIKQNDEETTTIYFNGPIDEFAHNTLSEIASKLSEVKSCCFNFSNIEYINSLGLRTWLNFFREFCKGKSITFEECAPYVVNQINFIEDFAGPAKITSFYGYFYCPDCNHEFRSLFKTDMGVDKLKEEFASVDCEKCGANMELDMDEDNFINFLKKDSVE